MGGEYVLRTRIVAEDGFSTPRTGLAQSSSATAYGNQYVHTAESHYPEAGHRRVAVVGGGGSDQRFKFSYT